MTRLFVCSLAAALALGLAPQPAPAESGGKNVGPAPAPAEEGAGPRRVPRANRTDVYVSGDVPKAIADNDAAGVTSTLSVSLPTELTARIADVNLVLDSLPHTCVADLHVELASPAGTVVPLILAFTESGLFSGLGCPDNFTGTVLDDDAPTTLNTAAAPYTGAFNVEHPSVASLPLSGFDGEDAAGTWTLAVSDRAGGDTGTLNAWSLELTLETWNDYECYKAKDLKQPTFTAVQDVPMTTTLQADLVDVKKPNVVCLPADKQGAGVSDPAIAHCCYKAKGTALKPAAGVQVSDDFGTHQLGLTKAGLVCVPCSVQTLP
jgi:subtilisin-like proprotein convertase family protein